MFLVEARLVIRSLSIKEILARSVSWFEKSRVRQSIPFRIDLITGLIIEIIIYLVDGLHIILTTKFLT